MSRPMGSPSGTLKPRIFTLRGRSLLSVLSFFRFSFFSFFFRFCLLHFLGPTRGPPLEGPKNSFYGRLDTHFLSLSGRLFFLFFGVVSVLGFATQEGLRQTCSFPPVFYGVLHFLGPSRGLPLEGSKNVILGPFRRQFPSLFGRVFFFHFLGPPSSLPSHFFVFFSWPIWPMALEALDWLPAQFGLDCHLSFLRNLDRSHLGVVVCSEPPQPPTPTNEP